jgi:hypothetical protein
MAEVRRPQRGASLRRRWAACLVALVVALGAVAFLVLGVLDHRDARDQLTSAEHDYVTARAATSDDGRALSRVLQVLDSVRDDLAGIGKGAPAVADLDQQDDAAVRAAVEAGLAGDVAAYNAAVDHRTTLDPQHAAAVEQLRQQANAVITALDAVR